MRNKKRTNIFIPPFLKAISNRKTPQANRHLQFLSSTKKESEKLEHNEILIISSEEDEEDTIE